MGNSSLRLYLSSTRGVGEAHRLRGRKPAGVSFERLTSRKLQAGSRLVVVLSINKQPDLQITYGTGKDVSDESIQDAKVPLRIQWYGDSYVDIPVWR
jgi:hypothetical protein